MKLHSFKSGCLWCFIAFVLCHVVRSRDLYEIISSDKQLEKFYSHINKNDAMKFMLTSVEATVFAPTNDAWDRYPATSGLQLNKILNYHMVKSSITSNNFPASLPTEATGGLPLWVSKHDVSHTRIPRYEYFANQGRIIRMDIKGETQNGYSQVLHIIDEVLEPTLPINDDIGSRNPSAYRIISAPQSYSINQDLTQFQEQVDLHKKEFVFQGGDGHTFFVPVSGNNDVNVWSRVVDQVIDGHIIPNKVYFSRAFPSDPQPTLAFSHNLHTLISMRNESFNQHRQYSLSVLSNTIVGIATFPKGTVTAKIVKADIPVKNGVVHLIENPLIIVTKDLQQLLQQNSQLSRFYEELQKSGRFFLDRLIEPEMTLFAPTNDAFDNIHHSRMNMVLNDETKLRQMLEFHLVTRRVTTEMVLREEIKDAPTLNPVHKLHFGHTHHNVTVVGGGVNATITTADIMATNGVLQIINRLMGIPYLNIYDKLSSDPGLSSTFKLGQQQSFNEQFENFNTRYTYFVPNNDAWNSIRQRYTSEYYKLFSGDYPYQVKKILNRHLVVNKAYSLNELMTLKTIQMVEGKFQFFKEGERYYIKWEGVISEIIDSNVEAGNGKVHVIRNVLFKPIDLTTNSASEIPLHSLLTFLLSSLFVLFIV